MESKRGQVTIFIILAIVNVAGIALFIYIRSEIELFNIPPIFRPVENFYLDCVKSYTETGISLLGENSGYIYWSNFEPGNDYSPTSNQLDFFGTGIPFWYYASGKDIVKEQVPTKQDMEQQLEKYLDENLKCDFSSFSSQGFAINLSKPEIDVQISDSEVKVDVSAELRAEFEDESFNIRNHETVVKSKLGKFYEEAVKIYNKEKESAFLEDYAIDVLYLYAPVSVVELTCSTQVWLYE